MPGLRFGRRHTEAGKDVFDSVAWETRTAELGPFRQEGVEFPESWSQNATNIVADKYFRGPAGDREHSLRQVVTRLADWYAATAEAAGYFAGKEDAAAFRDELAHLLLHQRAAPNSPAWFNVGRTGDNPPRVSACFTLAVRDSMRSILRWYTDEGLVFKAGSGAGVNLSRVREEGAPLRDGGRASGPVSFMLGADASAGTIKSGGSTRRAAKMVILNADHPDVEKFVACKAEAERVARALKAAGFDVGVGGKDAWLVPYQNANDSVGATDEFLRACEAGGDWHLTSRVDGRVVKTLPARSLLRQIARAAWECACPGLQYLGTMNRWHTSPDTGYLDTTNPCSEFVRNLSSCNLASLRLTKYLTPPGGFDANAFHDDVELLITAMDASVGAAEYPTDDIRKNVQRYRELGLGYTDLGALLMSLGLPYDSDAGRAWAATVTALMAGVAWRQSAYLAKELGPYPGWESAANRKAHLRVMHRHKAALDGIDRALVPEELIDLAVCRWWDAINLGEKYGYRNAQVSLLAPCGTISFAMDCDTTGIEPDFSLAKTKKLAGGGSMRVVNQCVPKALARLGYPPAETESLAKHVLARGGFAGSALRPEHRPVFACAVGDDAIPYMGHVRMMAAVQPFLCGAISKTVNMPHDVSVEDVEELYLAAWRMGLKSVAIYRNGCKADQPLNAGTPAKVPVAAPPPPRRKLPKRRRGLTSSYRLAGCKGYVRTGEFPDGTVGELFLDAAKQGSTLAGILDCFAIAVSLGLQHGVPLASFVEKFSGQSFPPQGVTGDPDVPMATSLVDYVFRRLAADYLTPEVRQALNVQTAAERAAVLGEGAKPVSMPELPAASPAGDAPMCDVCGVLMVRAGACWCCRDCGRTSGCS